jgi:hypothetical protein
MSRIFGIPADTLMYVLLGAFAVCLLVAVWIIIRHRVIFRMAIRNIPRRPTQTILIMIGLMLSTTIIAAALTTGDIMQHTIRSDVFEVAGYSDEFIVKAGPDEEQARPLDGVTFPESVIHDLRATVGDDPNIDGMMPVFSEPVPVLHQAADLGQPALNMVGLDFDQIEAFGGLSSINGATIAISAWRVSRITIVAAIRNLPDPARPDRGLRGSLLAIALLVGGIVALIGGHIILNPFVFGLGITLIPFAVAMLLHRRDLSDRIVLQPSGTSTGRELHCQNAHL